jgi:hypothetical protein
MRPRSLSLSFALSVVFFGGPSLSAEPDSNCRVLVLQAPPVISVLLSAIFFASRADFCKITVTRASAISR